MPEQRITRLPEHRRVSSPAPRIAPIRSPQAKLSSPVLQLQRTLGNRRLAQLLQAKRITPEGKIIGLQRKLNVGAADDHYEQEADRVAHQVMSMPDSVAVGSFQQTPTVVGQASQLQTLQSKPLPLAASITPYVQQQMENGGSENGSIQATSAGFLTNSFEAGDDVESRLNQSKGSGSPLPDPVRAYMEPRFGVDFSHVRVHTGSDAIQMSRDVGAQAFTHGSDIYYGAGNSPSNLELSAHELTHVVQQTGHAPLRRKQLDGADTDPSLQRTCAACSAGNEEEKRSDTISTASPVARQIDAKEPEAAAGSVASEVASEATAQTPAPDGRGGEVVHSTARSPEEDPEIASSRGPIPSNTVTCLAKWQPCRAPYSPGTWAARITYHCPRLILPWGIILPGTTQPAFVTIPDEFVGPDPTGRDMFRCRPRVSVNFGVNVADSVAFALTRGMLFPTQATCHAGFRANLLVALEAMFTPSGGGRPAGIRVNQTAPGGGGLPFPCP